MNKLTVPVGLEHGLVKLAIKQKTKDFSDQQDVWIQVRKQLEYEVDNVRKENKDLSTKLAAFTHPNFQAMSDDTLLEELTWIRARLLALEREQLRREISFCEVCHERSKDTKLNCGHVYCKKCGDQVKKCPTCRVYITRREKVYL